jgi:hypothetical protein
MPSIGGLEKVGIAGLAIVTLWVFFKIFQLFMGQWKQSTDAVNRNSKSFEKLSAVFEKQAEREEKFQHTVISAIAESARIATDTNAKVSEIHGNLVLKRRTGNI